MTQVQAIDNRPIPAQTIPQTQHYNLALDAIQTIVSTRNAMEGKTLSRVNEIETLQKENADLIGLSKELVLYKDDDTLSAETMQKAVSLNLIDAGKAPTAIAVRQQVSARMANIKSKQEIHFVQMQPTFQFLNALTEVAQAILRMNDRVIGKTQQLAR